MSQELLDSLRKELTATTAGGNSSGSSQVYGREINPLAGPAPLFVIVLMIATLALLAIVLTDGWTLLNKLPENNRQILQFALILQFLLLYLILFVGLTYQNITRWILLVPIVINILAWYFAIF